MINPLIWDKRDLEAKSRKDLGQTVSRVQMASKITKTNSKFNKHSNFWKILSAVKFLNKLQILLHQLFSEASLVL